MIRGEKLKATDILTADHKQVLEKLAKLETGLDNLDIDARTRSEIVSVAEFIKDDVRMHFLNEEEVLFPLLEKVPGMREGPLKMMNVEHEEFRKNNERLQEMAERLRFHEDLSGFRDELIETGRAIIILLREHIDKEDNVLFPMAQRFLGDKTLFDAAKKMRIAKGTVEVDSNVIELDLRSIDALERHPLIFDTFDGIMVGEEIKLINDHDTRSLHYRFEAERRGKFTWRSDEEGPEKWVSYIKKIA